MRSTAKAQIEIVGLAVIVVIIVILILFFSIRKASSGINEKQDTLSAEAAQSFLESIMHKKTQCGPELQDIIISCYGTDDNCGGSCEYAKTTIKSSLESNFGVKNKGYNFFAEKDGSRKLEIASDGKKCTKTTVVSGSGVFALPDFPGVISVELELC